ncbi:MAG: hypothetical protein Q4E37_05520 [Tissierellia bacterium]|nr:hypothetical protein [Tissierellia bacterium]
MDWSKAKNILLVGLIIANLTLLVFFLEARQRMKNPEYSQEFLEESRALLEEEGVTLKAQVPQEPQTLGSLQVTIQEARADQVNRDFFQGRGEVLSKPGSLDTISLGQDQVSLIANRRILYEKGGRGQGEDLERDQAQDLAMFFLDKRGYETSDLSLVHGDFKEGKWFLSYTMVYEGVPVESTYTHFIIEGEEVLRMDRFWIQVLGKEEETYVLPSGAKALLSLLGQEAYKGRTLKAMTPCYYFNPEAQGSVEEISQSLQGKATPAWRLVFEDGEELVLDLF